jgi:transketolase
MLMPEPQRDVFWTRIYQRALQERDIIIVSADMGAPSLDAIRRDLPDQFVNVGIAEQNGLLIAAGLARQGKRPFLYGIAPFVSLRCIEQIRVECAIMKIPLTVVGVGVGFGYDDSGPTHHLVEDVAMMRAMPNINIVTPSDNAMMQAVADECLDHPAPRYLRLDRQALPDLYDSDTDFRPGFVEVCKGADGVIVADGYMTHVALQVREMLSKKGRDFGVIDLFRLPPDREALLERLEKQPRVITLEEHYTAGGMGSWVLEALNERGSPVPVQRLGLPIEQGYSYTYGGRDIILDEYGLSAKNIAKIIEE